MQFLKCLKLQLQFRGGCPVTCVAGPAVTDGLVGARVQTASVRMLEATVHPSRAHAWAAADT